MALIINRQPKAINLSGNPVWFQVISTTVVNRNHKIHIQAMDQFGLIGEEAITPINAVANFDMSDYCKQDKKLRITIFNLLDRLPNFEELSSYISFKIFETYDNDGIQHNATNFAAWFVHGGFSKIYLENYNKQNKNFYDNFLTADKKFLTWAPAKKLTWNQHDFLWWLPDVTMWVYYKITMYFTDNTNQAIDSAEKYVLGKRLAYINTSYLANLLDTYETTNKKINYYNVQVFNSDDVAQTEIKTYYIDRNTYNFGRQFIFKNSLGAYDIMHLKGLSEHNNEIQRTIGYFDTKDQVTYSEFSENYKVASGFVVNSFADLSSAQRYITELINSREIYEIVGKEIVPIVCLNDKLNVNKDKEFLYSFTFEYKYAYTDSFFSPLTTQQYLNPRIFYRNGIIENVAPGMVATVDFDVWINEASTVSFELDWGDGVGITALNNVSILKEVTKSLTDQITIPGNVYGYRTLTISDSLGGKYYIQYLVTDSVVLWNDGEESEFNDEEQILFNL